MRIWAALAAISTASAATAVLDCIGDGFGVAGKRWRGDGAVLELDARGKTAALQFRSTSLKGWRATGAKLMVHVERGELGAQVFASYAPPFAEAKGPGKLSPAVSVKVAEAGAGWWRIDLPAGIVQGFADQPDGAILLRTGKGKAAAIHGRAALHFTPRLIVEGAPAP